MTLRSTAVEMFCGRKVTAYIRRDWSNRGKL